MNVYGTDITAAKWVTKFPDQNPNPVLRFTLDGSLVYANGASDITLRGLGVGERLAGDVFVPLKAIAEQGHT